MRREGVEREREISMVSGLSSFGNFGTVSSWWVGVGRNERMNDGRNIASLVWRIGP